MKAIVTGGAGFIGTALVNRLLDMDWEILIVDDYSTHMYPDYTEIPPGVRFVEGAVQDVKVPRSFWGSDAVFHLAGKVGPVGVLRWKGQIAYDTVTAAHAVANWAALDNCPLIFMSTSEVYGSPDAANSETTYKVFREHTARSEYAVSKLAAENMLVNMSDIDVRIIRPFNVTGAGQRPEGGFVLPRFAQQALNGDGLTVYQPGTQRRSFTHIDDIIDGTMLVYEYGQKREAYNLGNPNNTRTILELAQMVIAEVGEGHVNMVDPVDLHGPSFVEAPEKIPDATKAMQQLGFDPQIGIEQIVADVVRYERENG